MPPVHWRTVVIVLLLIDSSCLVYARSGRAEMRLGMVLHMEYALQLGELGASFQACQACVTQVAPLEDRVALICQQL